MTRKMTKLPGDTVARNEFRNFSNFGTHGINLRELGSRPALSSKSNSLFLLKR